MKWFLVRLKPNGIAYALKTRQQANRLRDMSGSKLQTVEVIPAFKIREIMAEWDKMIKQNEFEGGPLSVGEVACIRACKQDLLERLDSL